MIEIEEWVLDAAPVVLQTLGLRTGERVPTESTIRRTLARMDQWSTRHRHRWELDAWGRQKMEPGHTCCRCLTMTSMDITNTVITADVLHCQRETAKWITDRCGHYVLTVKGNQPKLLKVLKALPWADVPAFSYVEAGHGRRTRCTLKAVNVPDWIDFPGASQILQVRRTRTRKGRKSTEVVYVICSLAMEDASMREVASWVQGHWRIENVLHWVRDVTFDEDRHQLRNGAGPQGMATLRNTAISLLRLAGWDCIAKELQHHHAGDTRPVLLVTTP